MSPRLLLSVLAAGIFLTATVSGVPTKLNDRAKSAPLDHLHADAGLVSVSGLGAGGFAAVQFHVAFSADVMGAGVVAGGPFYCAGDNLATAETACTKTPSLISPKALEVITRTTCETFTIDCPQHLAASNVFLFSGSNDKTVNPGVVRKLQEYYSAYIIDGHIQAVYDVPAAYGWPTLAYGSSCNTPGSPYLLSCNYDLAGKVLQHIYSNTSSASSSSSGLDLRRSSAVDDSLVAFDQTEYFHLPVTAHAAAMADSGYAYIPASCRVKEASCAVHVALHACEMSLDKVGDSFIKNSGLNEWAEGSGIIILYPQARASVTDPKGCWDWWGATGPDYASNIGLQNRAIRDMVSRLLQ